MLWRILGGLGSFTFLRVGFSVLLDPDCVSVEFSGGRAVTLTCYSDNSGAVSGPIAGFVSVVFGSLLAWLALGPWIQRTLSKRHAVESKDNSFGGEPEIFENSMTEGEDSQKSIQAKGSKECPLCAETIKAKAIICRYCGSAIKAGTNENQNVQGETGIDKDLVVAIIAFSVFGAIVLYQIFGY